MHRVVVLIVITNFYLTLKFLPLLFFGKWPIQYLLQYSLQSQISDILDMDTIPKVKV
jgi:hypothetical protein